MWCIIINPNAAAGTAGRQQTQLERSLQAQGTPYVLIATSTQGHAIDIVQQQVAAGHRRFVAVGGDGTINEVVNGICLQNIVPISALTLAVVPIGTGNDWVKMHQIPRNIANAVALLQQPKTIAHRIGQAEPDRPAGDRQRIVAARPLQPGCQVVGG